MINQSWSCVECPRCHGTGYIDVRYNNTVQVETCPLCNGTGDLKQYHDSSSLSKNYESNADS